MISVGPIILATGQSTSFCVELGKCRGSLTRDLQLPMFGLTRPAIKPRPHRHGVNALPLGHRAGHVEKSPVKGLNRPKVNLISSSCSYVLCA